MPHTEQIKVYQHTAIPNDSGGFVPTTPILETLAPTWATIEQASGWDRHIYGTATISEELYKITVNYRPGFSWLKTMYINCRFGYLDITNIQEDARKRTIKIMGVMLKGVDATTGEGAAGSSGINVVYARPTYGSRTLNIPALIGANILIMSRDGIGKEIVPNTPESTNQMQFISDGTINLAQDDAFGNELVTVLYKS